MNEQNKPSAGQASTNSAASVRRSICWCNCPICSPVWRPIRIWPSISTSNGKATGTPSLFDLAEYGGKTLELSNSDKERLPILHHLRQEAGERKLQVSLNSSSGLCTKNPANPLNFWFCTPQHANDKAPRKPAH